MKKALTLINVDREEMKSLKRDLIENWADWEERLSKRWGVDPKKEE